MSASSVSWTADANVRYERLAAEYTKLRAQAGVLKDGVLSERAKAEKLANELKSAEASVRRLRSENESLQFRNSQLVRRVESLQEEADASARRDKGGKKDKSSKKESVSPKELQEMQQRVVLMENELADKLMRNEQLAGQISEMERVHSEEMSALSEKLRQQVRRLEEQIREQAAERSREKEKEQREREHARKEVHAVAPMPVVRVEEREEEKERGQPVSLPSAHTTATLDDGESIHACVLSARSLLGGIATLLHLIEQRCRLYPFDASMERLPPYMEKLATELSLAGGEMASVLSVCDRVVDKGQVEFSSDVPLLCSALSPLSSRLSTLPPLLTQLQRDESRSHWCTGELEHMNARWCRALTSFVCCVEKVAVCVKEDVKGDTVYEALHALAVCMREWHEACACRWRLEQRLPTATKRLLCVGEATVECAEHAAAEASRLAARAHAATIAHPPQHATPTLAPPTLAPPTLAPPTADEVSEEEEEEGKSVEEVLEEERGRMEEEWREKEQAARQQTEQLRARIAQLEQERERHLVDLSLLRRKVENGKGAGSGEAGPETDDIALIRQFYGERIRTATADGKAAVNKTKYYREECEILVSKTRVALEERRQVEVALERSKEERERLADALESTRRTYEMQLGEMSERMAALTAKKEDKGMFGRKLFNK